MSYPAGGPDYVFRYDNMGRVNAMQDFNASGYPTVATATYGVSNELLTLAYFGLTETRAYNSLLQLTRQTVAGAVDMQYVYTAGQNNGRITSSVDGIWEGTINYLYDSLNRLSSATAANAAWGQAFTYDGFGNLTDKTVTVGSAPSMHVAFDPVTNRQLGITYDANGNPTSNGLYDVENRLVQTASELYTYDYKGKRLTKRLNNGTTEVYFYGINGQKLMTLTCTGQPSAATCGSPVFNVYFRGKLIKSKGVVVATDRLGSVRWDANNGVQAYFPYGEERTTTSDNREKFGTYTRDNLGQDYADQRYYGVGTGRFFTVDQSFGALMEGGIVDTGRLNLYARSGDIDEPFTMAGTSPGVPIGIGVTGKIELPGVAGGPGTTGPSGLSQSPSVDGALGDDALVSISGGSVITFPSVNTLADLSAGVYVPSVPFSYGGDTFGSADTSDDDDVQRGVTAPTAICWIDAWDLWRINGPIKQISARHLRR
jgi:YD repeat-containing protein